MKIITDVVTDLLIEAVDKSFNGEIDHKDISVQFTKDIKLGHFQTNIALVSSKKLRRNPREIATKILENIETQSIIEKTDIAGPGFINFFLSSNMINSYLRDFNPNSWDYDLNVEKGVTVIDYSSPNIAKRMHIAHLRSTIIGESIKRMYKFMKREVIADNHLGDWGTQFGKLIVGYNNWLDKSAYQTDPLAELERIYVKFEQESAQNEALLPEARKELKKLQDGDEINTKLWKEFVDTSITEYNKLYKRLNVSFDTYWGESYYVDSMPSVIKELEEKRIAKESQGALIVEFDESEHLHPCLIRKSDGATLYATSDLACIKKKRESYDLNKLIYVTDDRQADHFKQFFRVSEMLGWDVNNIHVTFGLMKFADSHFSSRKGNVIRLETLLDEAESRALKIVEEKNPELSTEEKKEIARVVGIGAVKYSDLSQNRSSTIVFDWDKNLSFEGNTSPYLQYVYARIQSILRKTEFDTNQKVDNLIFESEIENKIILQLTKFHSVIDKAAESCKPNVIADYVYELAQLFNTFYNAINIIKSEESEKQSRLLLIHKVALTIKSGLDLLGIEVLDRM
ncbi:arginine--tRNA ligase [Thiospirochaeta perfilievii]|uniref:Arginine--tRNA ligase n=1 Tax=Thiospirochaeta perfilievii TaxID=252967 RepID=A0A5C1QDQ0_9SPIO|nr:arginine--tRNA ligase [Thiospirochaeta perfilievii]QEN04854.1 arginine--tRNA ligase [Thiospirochaeta perfilievii]